LNKKFVVAFDVEGPIVDPSFDFAWLVLENLVKVNDLKTLSEKVKVFDEYDDNRWLRERGMEGHSTGTTPIVSSLLAVAYGAKNEDFLNLAKQHLKLTPGASRLLGWLKDEKRIQPYFISSAHPAAVLPVAYKLGIPSSHVFCSGYQLAQAKAESYDKQRTEKLDSDDQTMQKEIKERFPYEKYSNSESLQNFLNRFLDLCVEMNKSYASGRTDEEAVRNSREKQLRLLEEARKEISTLADDLRYLLYSEDGVMGAHRKKRALMSIEKLEKAKKENLIYSGDSIVDADAIAYAGYGISINCTNRQALISSKINVATTTLESLIPIIEHISSGADLTIELRDTIQERINEAISPGNQTTPPTRIFTRNEIDNKIEAVMQANRLCKEYMKKIKSDIMFRPL
jgi:predicted HAD superfamily phosphohydrolase